MSNVVPLKPNAEGRRRVLVVEERVVRGKVRKYYSATEAGRQALVEVRAKVRELVDEVLHTVQSNVSAHISPPEREAVAALQEWGLTDVFRRIYPQPGVFSWWDYRAGDFHQGRGLRIDLVLATARHPAMLTYLDQHKIGTRLLFAGNLTRQPYMIGRNYRVSGDLTNTDRVMNDTFWVGVYPGLTREMLDYVVDRLETFFGVNF